MEAQVVCCVYAFRSVAAVEGKDCERVFARCLTDSKAL